MLRAQSEWRTRRGADPHDKKSRRSISSPRGRINKVSAIGRIRRELLTRGGWTAA